MTRIAFAKTVNFRRLAEELESALPELARADDWAQYVIEDAPDGWAIVHATGAPDAAIAAVVDAHDGSPDPPPVPRQQEEAVLASAIDAVAASTTVAELRTRVVAALQSLGRLAAEAR
jgi:hypothetical protein